MPSFPFHFTTNVSGKPVAFSFNIHDKLTEEEAKAELLEQLADITTQIEAYTPKSGTPAPAPTEEAAPAEEETPTESEDTEVVPEDGEEVPAEDAAAAPASTEEAAPATKKAAPKKK